MTVTPASALSVRKTVTVSAPQAIAFEVFTTRIASWWPMATHKIGQADCATVIIEPQAGGRWFERGTDGVECDWGRVLAWEPPGRVLLTWQLSVEQHRNNNLDAGSSDLLTFAYLKHAKVRFLLPCLSADANFPVSETRES